MSSAKPLYEFRNTPRACGKSPAEMLFGHQLRSIVPAHWLAFDPQWQGVIKAHERQLEIDAAIKARYDESTRTLPALHVGTKVRIQDHATKLWSHVGEIMSVGTKAGRPCSYRIKFANGSLLLRYRRHIKPMYAATSGEERRSGATALTRPATVARTCHPNPLSHPAARLDRPAPRWRRHTTDRAALKEARGFPPDLMISC